MVRIELTEEDSLAAIRARSKFGIAIAAMIKMMATTISNSISEKPFCLRFINLPKSIEYFVLPTLTQKQVLGHLAVARYVSRDLRACIRILVVYSANLIRTTCKKAPE